MSSLLPDDPSSRPQHQHALMRVSDTDRNQVADLLSQAYADGRLTRDEHDERLASAMQAKTFGDLAPLTHDLTLDTLTPSSTPAAPANSTWAIDRSHQNLTADTVVAIFSGSTRKGQFRARRNISALTTFGGIDIDLTHATFEDNICEIQVFCMFGGVDITVPPGVTVQDETFNIFGGTDVVVASTPQPGTPTVIVKGFVCFGGVDVKDH